MLGTVFDIKEFALNDGDGIRTTVFFKGCPLRCIWCHNPEGLDNSPELYVKSSGCLNCGLCRAGCEHEDCRPFGRCLHVCPVDLISVAGKRYEAKELAEKLLRSADMLTALGGGITISGGEPLYQPEFLVELLTLLHGKVHVCIETSGCAAEEVFREVISLCDFVMMDIKLMDKRAHKLYTGADNALILKNAKVLMNSSVPHLFRTPLIPGITDTKENLSAISSFIGGEKIELLPYNRLAPAKYAGVSKVFTDKIDESLATDVDLSIFKNATMRK